MSNRFRLTGLRLVCLALCLLSASAAHAQTAAKPATGLWWSPGANGQFLQLNIGPGDYALVSLSYAADQQPTYRVLQGPLELLDPRSDDAIAEISSPLYRVDNAGCLTCETRSGVTQTEDSRTYRLRFLSGTRAILHTANDEQIAYEYYPLLQREQDLTANRVDGKRVSLENNGTAVLGRLRSVSPAADCGVQFGVDERSYQVQISSQGPRLDALGRYLQGTTLVIESGHNPRIRLLTRNDTVIASCPGGAGGCPNPTYTLTGSECVVAANLYEAQNVFAGPAESISHPNPAILAALTGDIRLTVVN